MSVGSLLCLSRCFFFFFFNDTATTAIYTLSLHDALPIYQLLVRGEEDLVAVRRVGGRVHVDVLSAAAQLSPGVRRSEEHTSELQSPVHLVCRLLLEKKNKITRKTTPVRS